MDDIDVDVDTTKLISAIKARPALYDRSLPTYNDQVLKRKLWIEVCQLVIPGWAQHSEKSQIGVKVQKRWQNIRTCFKKEYNLQIEYHETRKRRHTIKRRKMYEFYDQLQFLIPPNHKRFPISSTQETPTQAPREQLTYIPTTTTQAPREQLTNIPTTTTRAVSPIMFASTSRNTPTVDNPANIPQQKGNIRSSETIDEDKHFLLSLLPSFQRMNNNSQKLKVKMKFLQAISDIEEEVQQPTPSCHSCSRAGQEQNQTELHRSTLPEANRTTISDNSEYYYVINNPVKGARAQEITSSVPRHTTESTPSTSSVQDTSVVIKEEILLVD